MVSPGTDSTACELEILLIAQLFICQFKEESHAII